MELVGVIANFEIPEFSAQVKTSPNWPHFLVERLGVGSADFRHWICMYFSYLQYSGFFLNVDQFYPQ